MIDDRDSNERLRRQAELQTPGSDAPPKIDPSSYLTENRHVSPKPSREDTTSRGMPSGPRLVSEASRVRKPQDYASVERGQEGLQDIRDMSPGTRYRHGNIAVRRGGIVGGGGGTLTAGEEDRRQHPSARDEFVRRNDLRNLLLSLLPQELTDLCYNEGSGGRPAAGCVPTITDGTDGRETSWEYAIQVVYGNPALYMVVSIRGWSKASAAAAWAAMTVAEEAANPPTKMWDEFVDGTDAYPWYGWRPTWDYTRAHA